MRQRWYLLAALLGVLILATACGGDEPAADPDDGAAGNEPGPVKPMEIAGVTWTSGVTDDTGEPVDSVESFTTISPSIIAVVEATNVPAGTGFTATWSIDGIDVPETTMEVTVEEDMTLAYVAFEFIRDEGRYFPLGELQVVVTASSGESVDATVDIQLP